MSPAGCRVKRGERPRGSRAMHERPPTRNLREYTAGRAAGGRAWRRAMTPTETRSSRSMNMRIGILSDIHGNLPALEAVIADVMVRELDAVYCLGDLVGYGAFPNEVVGRIRNLRMPTIMGNYDDGVGFDRDDCG